MVRDWIGAGLNGETERTDCVAGLNGEEQIEVRSNGEIILYWGRFKW